jgi:hypothetical protein
MSTINWNCTREESLVIDEIIRRFQNLAPNSPAASDKAGLMMDIEACHCNGCPLRLDELLQSNNFDFLHDVAGIYRNLDRLTGKLQDCFLPRFAA